MVDSVDVNFYSFKRCIRLGSVSGIWWECRWTYLCSSSIHSLFLLIWIASDASICRNKITISIYFYYELIVWKRCEKYGPRNEIATATVKIGYSRTGLSEYVFQRFSEFHRWNYSSVVKWCYNTILECTSFSPCNSSSHRKYGISNSCSQWWTNAQFVNVCVLRVS